MDGGTPEIERFQKRVLDFLVLLRCDGVLLRCVPRPLLNYAFAKQFETEPAIVVSVPNIDRKIRRELPGRVS